MLKEEIKHHESENNKKAKERILELETEIVSLTQKNVKILI